MLSLYLLWEYEACKRRKIYLFLSKLCLIFAKCVCDFIAINAVHFNILKNLTKFVLTRLLMHVFIAIWLEIIRTKPQSKDS